MNIFVFLLVLIILALVTVLSFYTGFAVGTSDKRYIQNPEKSKPPPKIKREKAVDPVLEAKRAELNRVLENVSKYDGTAATATRRERDT